MISLIPLFGSSASRLNAVSFTFDNRICDAIMENRFVQGRDGWLMRKGNFKRQVCNRFYLKARLMKESINVEIANVILAQRQTRATFSYFSQKQIVIGWRCKFRNVNLSVQLNGQVDGRVNGTRRARLEGQRNWVEFTCIANTVNHNGPSDSRSKWSIITSLKRLHFRFQFGESVMK